MFSCFRNTTAVSPIHTNLPRNDTNSPRPRSTFHEVRAKESFVSEKTEKEFFSFHYKKKHVLARMIEEDKHALHVLTDPIHNKNVFDIANQFADKIESSEFDYDAFQIGCWKMKDDHPVLRWDRGYFEDKESFIAFLRNPKTKPVHLLSVLWFAPKYITPVDPKTEAVFQLYNNIIKHHRDHIDNTDLIRHRNDSFGNSKKIKSDMFRSFFPYSHDTDYREINKATTNAEVKKYLENNIPYVSGTSGMANVASNIFHLLDIPIESELGKSFSESVSAFIVGSGMHSYHEVYTSFNLYREHIVNR